MKHPTTEYSSKESQYQARILDGPRRRKRSLGALLVITGALYVALKVLDWSLGWLKLLIDAIPSLIVVGVFFFLAALVAIIIYRSVVNETR